MSRFGIFAVYLLCSGLNNEDKRQSAPYRDPVLHVHAPRLIALRGGDRDEVNPKAKNKGGMLMRRACARTPSPRSFLLLEHRLQPTPSPLCGLASSEAPWALLGAFSISRRSIYDLVRTRSWPCPHPRSLRRQAWLFEVGPPWTGSVSSFYIFIRGPTHPIRGATLNLFQKTWVLGSGNWVGLRSAKSGDDS